MRDVLATGACCGGVGGVLLRRGGVSRLMIGGDPDPFMLKLSGDFIAAIGVFISLTDTDDVESEPSLLLPELLLAGDDADDNDRHAGSSVVSSSSSDSVRSMTSCLAGESGRGFIQKVVQSKIKENFFGGNNTFQDHFPQQRKSDTLNSK